MCVKHLLPAGMLMLVGSPLFAQSVAPAPTSDPGSWILTSDYPTQQLEENITGTTSFSLSIDATGRVTDCQVIESSGDSMLDSKTCELVSERATFEPASNDEGTAVPGRYESRVRWEIPQYVLEEPSKKGATLTLTLDSDGGIVDCKQVFIAEGSAGDAFGEIPTGDEAEKIEKLNCDEAVKANATVKLLRNGVPQAKKITIENYYSVEYADPSTIRGEELRANEQSD